MQGMKGLIIDVRNNPGGLLDEAINIASIFVPDGEIVTYTMDKYEDKTEYCNIFIPCKPTCIPSN